MKNSVNFLTRFKTQNLSWPILHVRSPRAVRHEVAHKSCLTQQVVEMRPPMLLGESTPLNKERGGQRSKALATARGLKRKPGTLLVANTR